MALCFFDTEATGLKPNRLRNPKNLKTIDRENWRMLSIAYIIMTADGERELLRRSSILSVDFHIPEESIKVHGITPVISKEKGRPLINVLRDIQADLVEHGVTKLIAHNIAFDRTLLLSEVHRVKERKLYEYLEGLEYACTSKMYAKWRGWTRDYCALDQALGFLFPSRKRENRHEALADAGYCRDIYFEISKCDYNGFVASRSGGSSSKREETSPRSDTIEERKWNDWDGCIDTSYGEFGDPFDPDNPYNWDGDDMIGFR